MTTRYLPSPLGNEVTDAVSEMAADAMAADGMRGESGWSPPGLWRELAAGGWTQLADGEPPGAEAEVGLLDLCAMAEAWGRALVGLPLLSTLAVRRWLTDRPEPGEGLTLVIPEFDRFLVPGAAHTVRILADGETIPYTPPSTMDRYAPSLPVAVLDEAPATPAPASVLRDYALLVTAEAVGAADRALVTTTGYATTRFQFDRPIGSFQAVKHTLADMHRDVEMARSGVTWFSNEPEALATSAPYVLAMCSAVVERAIQLHGGIGYTWECDLHWSLRHVAQAHRVVTAALAAADRVGSAR